MVHATGSTVTRNAVLLIGLLFSLTFGADEFFVSFESGSDGNSGASFAQPFKTLVRAREAIRAQNAGMTADITVYLLGGYHFLDSTFTLGTDDGGRNGFMVRFRNYDSNVPIISGGIRVTAWTPVPGTDPQQWQAPCPINKKVRTLYVNGESAYRSVGPTVSAVSGWGMYEGKPDGFVAEVNGQPLSPVANPEDMEIYKATAWGSHTLSVADIITEGSNTVVRMQQPVWAIAQSPLWQEQCPKIGDNFLLQNAREFLDHEGEFYFDRLATTLYYIPRSGEDMASAEVFAPRVECLVRIAGVNPGEKVANIEFSGIAFHHDAYQLLKFSDTCYGCTSVQSGTCLIAANSNAGGVTYQGMMELMFADNIRVTRCRFEHGGGQGLNLINGVENTLVTGNTFQDLSGNMLSVGNYLTDEPTSIVPWKDGGREIARNILVSNNVTRKTCLEFTHAPNLSVFNSANVEVLHNDLGSVGYQNIQGNLWDTVSNNVYRGNLSTSAMQHHVDGGHWYCGGNSNMDGSIVDSNFFRDSGLSVIPLMYAAQGRTPGQVTCPGWGALYPDVNTRNLTIRDNVYEGMCDAITAWWGGEGENLVYGDIWFWDLANGACCAPVGNQHQYPAGIRPPQVQAIIDYAGLEDGFTDLLTRLDWNPGEPIFFDNTPPSTPQGLVGTAVSSAQADLTWQASSDAESGVDYYTVYRNGVRVATATVTSFSDIGLNENTAYTYTVAATNGGGVASSVSAPVVVTTTPDTRAPVVESVSATDATIIRVVFDEPVSPSSATTAANYQVAGLSMSEAILGVDTRTVYLTTSAMTDGRQYTLSVNNITDRATAANTITSPVQTDFTYTAVASRSAFDNLEAESYDAMSGVLNYGSTIGGVDASDWVGFDNVSFGTGANTVHVMVASPDGGGVVEFHIDSLGGTTIATLTLDATAGWGDFQEQSAAVTAPVFGVHDLYIVFTGRPNGVGDFNWFRFTAGAVGAGRRTTAAATSGMSVHAGAGAQLLAVHCRNSFDLTVFDVKGRVAAAMKGKESSMLSMDQLVSSSGVYFVVGSIDNQRISYKLNLMNR